MNLTISFYKHKRLILSVIIFVLVFSILGIPFTRWSFYFDDYGNLFRSQVKSLRDFFDFFINGDTEVICGTQSFVSSNSFISAYYRPMLFVYTFIQRCFFDLNGYYYHLFMVGIHALISVILFNIFLNFSSFLLAFLFALYFAFHPILFNWLGWLGGLQYHMQLLLGLGSIFLLKKYLDTKKLFFYFLSCFLFLVSVFSGEPPIVMPFWIILAVYFYEKYKSKYNIYFFKNLGRYVFISFGYWVVSCFYLGIKLYLYPLGGDGSKYRWNLGLFTFLKVRFFEFVTYIADLFNLTLMPKNHQLLKGCLIVLVGFFLFWLIIKNRKKSFLLFFVFSIGLFSWPSLLIKHCHRYVYFILPFFILFILFGIKFFQGPQKKIIKHFLVFILYLLLPINGYLLFSNLRQRESFLSKSDNAYKQLFKENNFKSKHLCFFNLPIELFREGFEQAIWVYSGDSSLVVDNIMLSFGCYNNKLKKKKQSDLGQNYFDKDAVYITWNYQKHKFVVLENL
jgi:hypothetical protein